MALAHHPTSHQSIGDDRSTPESIYNWVLSTPEALAVSGERDLTYAELWDESGRWASAVARHLSDPDGVVGVLRTRDTGVVTCQLGAWLAGVGYIPLDPTLPVPRITSFLREAGCTVVLTTPEYAHLLPDDVIAICAPDPVDRDRLAQPPSDRIRLAYVIFTSGSTGTPKGVEIEHRTLAKLMVDYVAQLGLRSGLRVSMLANLGFDCLILDVWGALWVGATIVIPDQVTFPDPVELLAFLDAADVHHAFIGTAMFERVLRSGRMPRTLASVITAGDVLRVWPPEDYSAAVYNGYGPTEATVLVTITGDLRAYADRTSLPPIGRVLPHAEVWLRSADGDRIDDVAVPGELVIGPSYLARGYRRHPERTADAFITSGDVRCYPTGDICQWRADGEIDFLGRRDRQVKLSGVRVELGEVESVVLACDGVRQVAVELLFEPQDRQLCAWLEGPVTEADVREQMVATVPPYLIPDRFVVVDTMPLTPNGKIDRRALVQATIGG